MPVEQPVTSSITPAGRQNVSPGEVRWSPDRVAAPAKGSVRWPGLIATLLMLAAAALLGRALWGVYMDGAWTRDGTVRAEIAMVAPEVGGNIVALPVADNQFVHKGDLLMRLDDVNYRNAVRLAEAALQQAQANAQNIDAEIGMQAAQITASGAQLAQADATRSFARQQAARYQALSKSSAGSLQNAQLYDSQLRQQEAAFAVSQAGFVQVQKRLEALKAQRVGAEAAIAQAAVQLDQARVNLERTVIHAPANGWVTNLLARVGDYAVAQRSAISIVDADSFWVDAYFEETSLAGVQPGDPVRIKLMGSSGLVRGHVEGIARAISVSNASPNVQGVATVNPIFTWIRLAQRIPVRIHVDSVPANEVLAAGMTATVQVDRNTIWPKAQ